MALNLRREVTENTQVADVDRMRPRFTCEKMKLNGIDFP